MTRKVDGHSDPCTQASQRPQGDEHHWWEKGAVIIVLTIFSDINQRLMRDYRLFFCFQV